MKKGETTTPAAPEVLPAETTPAPTRALAAKPKVNMALFERLAKDSDVDPEKLRALLDLQKDIMATQARQEFEAAFAVMHPKLPAIEKNGKILRRDRTVQSRFGRLEDIQAITTPIMAEHGFTLRHRTGFPKDAPGKVLVTGILTHVAGHFETSEFMADPDLSDFRTDIQSQGSTISYGRRYTTIDLLNIVTRGADNDGQGGHQQQQRVDDAQGAPRQREVVPPAGYDGRADEPITDPQRKRLFVIVKKSGRDEMDFRSWLKDVYKVNSTKEIRRKDYDDVCRSVEAKGPLPMPAPREVGQEG